MGMHHVKMGAHVSFACKSMMNEGAAHVLDLIDKVGSEIERAAMIPDAMNPFYVTLARTHSCKDMDLMPFPLERRCKLRNMTGDAPHSDRVKRFPRKHSDPHTTTPPV